MVKRISGYWAFGLLMAISGGVCVGVVRVCFGFWLFWRLGDLVTGFVFCKNQVFRVLLASCEWPMNVRGCADRSLILDVLGIVGCLGVVG
jgi:hypothetical protein